MVVNLVLEIASDFKIHKNKVNSLDILTKFNTKTLCTIFAEKFSKTL